MNAEKKIYFPGLHGLRFIAAAIVIVSHVEELKSLFGVRSGEEGALQTYTLLGDLAVTFFFVLSGFLITFLLLQERKMTETISLKKFYTRRVLRIFPLYYLIVISGFFLLPHFEGLYIPEWTDKMHDNFWPKAILYLTFFSNLAAVTIHPIPYVAPTWSIGVEEQFYLVWPVLMKYCKNTLRVLGTVILFYLIAAKGTTLLVDHHILIGRMYEVMAEFLFLTRVDCMAIGGVAAYLFFVQSNRLLDIIYNRFFQVVLYAMVIALSITGTTFGLFTHEIYALLFACIILNVGANKNTLITFENAALRFAGNISYGIYMYHLLCIRISLNLVWKWFDTDQPFGIAANVLLYAASILLNILLASGSYYAFELYFLKLKKRATVVPSGLTV